MAERERAWRTATWRPGNSRCRFSPARVSADSDIVTSASAAPITFIDKDDLWPIMAWRDCRAILLVNTAVPRDINYAVRDLGPVHMYDMDVPDVMCPVCPDEREWEMAKTLRGIYTTREY